MKITFPRVLRSEWTKLTTLRSTWILLGTVGVLIPVVAGLIGWRTGRDPASEYTPSLAAARAFLSVDLASLIFGVFGILLMTGEYGQGSIRSTLAAVPKRLPVLGAKALAFVGLTLPVMGVAVVASLLVSQAFADSGQRFGLGDDHMPRATIGAAVAPVALGLIGMGIGTVVRHTAAAITVYVGVLLVIPALIPAMLPERIVEDVMPTVPVAASQSLYAVGTTDGGGGIQLLDPGPAALTLIVWIIGILAVGAAVLKRRDA